MAHVGLTLRALALLLCLASPVRGRGSEKIQVSFAGNNVTLTCPTENGSLWKEKESGWEQKVNCSLTLCTIVDYLGTWHNGRYSCGLKGTDIYLHVRECPGCVEIGIWVLTGIIASDLLVTLGVLILTYHCRQKRAAHFGGGPAAGGPRARPRGQREDRPPPVPNPDYEPIRKGQREVYAGLEPRGAF